MSRRRKTPQGFTYSEARDVKLVGLSPQPKQEFTTEFREAVLEKLAAGESLPPRLQLAAERFRTILALYEEWGDPLPSGQNAQADADPPALANDRPAHRPAAHAVRDAQIVKQVEFDLAELRAQRDRGCSNVSPDKAAHGVAAEVHGTTAENVKAIHKRDRSGLRRRR